MDSQVWINGEWRKSQGGNTLEVENPATGEIVGQVCNASAADVDAAVQAAKTAFEDGRWSKLPPKDRSKVLARMADIVEARQEEIARIESEAIMLANDVDFGLTSSVFTKDVARAMRVSAALEFGTFWGNDHLPLTSETPHGGFKKSGFGKDLSSKAIHDYQTTKHVMIAL